MDAVPGREAFRYWLRIGTRWSDNDLYGHVNNVTYYSYFDTVANRFLIDRCGLDIHHSPVIAVVAESRCNYQAPLAYPQDIEAGLRVLRLGRRAVTWGLGVFAAGRATAAAHGHFVHVFVDRATRRAVPIPTQMREAMAQLQADDNA